MLDKTWRSLKNFFSSKQNKASTNTATEGDPAARSLSDEDYEFLFEQLLEGVAHGWQTSRVQRFFEQLGEQGHHAPWIHWLQRYYGPKVLASPVPDLDLAQRLVLLAYQTQYIPKIMEIGAMSNAIAQQIQLKTATSPIWEYDGPDAGEFSDSSNAPQPQPEYLTADELLVRLQQDDSLAQQLAEQLGISDTDPQTLVRVLLERLQPESEEQ